MEIPLSATDGGEAVTSPSVDMNFPIFLKSG